jgi:hypothetical protein
MNAKLEGRVPRGDGQFGGNRMSGESEQAMLAAVPKERIVGAYKVLPKGDGVKLGPFTPNPNYRPLK